MLGYDVFEIVSVYIYYPGTVQQWARQCACGY